MIVYDRGLIGKEEVFAIIVADLHLHHHPAWRLDWCDRFVKALLDFGHQLTRDQESPPHLVLLGDALEVRDRLDARVMNQALHLVETYPRTTGGHVYWLAGQHDSSQPYLSTFRGLQNAEKITIVDDRVEVFPDIDQISMVPYARDPATYREWLSQVRDEDVVLTHLPILEVLQQFGPPPEDCIEAEEFERFYWTYSGDIHQSCTHGKVEYIGAPSQRDWRDVSVEGCIGLLTADYELVRVPVAHPTHKKLSPRQAASWASDKPPPGQWVLKVSGEVSNEVIDVLRSHERVLDVLWEPPSVTQVLDQTDGEDLSGLSDAELVDAFLESLDLPSNWNEERIAAIRRTGLELVNDTFDLP